MLLMMSRSIRCRTHIQLVSRMTRMILVRILALHNLNCCRPWVVLSCFSKTALCRIFLVYFRNTTSRPLLFAERIAHRKVLIFLNHLRFKILKITTTSLSLYFRHICTYKYCNSLFWKFPTDTFLTLKF